MGRLVFAWIDIRFLEGGEVEFFVLDGAGLRYSRKLMMNYIYELLQWWVAYIDAEEVAGRVAQGSTEDIDAAVWAKLEIGHHHCIAVYRKQYCRGTL